MRRDSWIDVRNVAHQRSRTAQNRSKRTHRRRRRVHTFEIDGRNQDWAFRSSRDELKPTHERPKLLGRALDRSFGKHSKHTTGREMFDGSSNGSRISGVVTDGNDPLLPPKPSQARHHHVGSHHPPNMRAQRKLQEQRIDAAHMVRNKDHPSRVHRLRNELKPRVPRALEIAKVVLPNEAPDGGPRRCLAKAPQKRAHNEPKRAHSYDPRQKYKKNWPRTHRAVIILTSRIDAQAPNQGQAHVSDRIVTLACLSNALCPTRWTCTPIEDRHLPTFAQFTELLQLKHPHKGCRPYTAADFAPNFPSAR